MGSRNSRSVALLSIHPEHADSILEGRKKVEFRKVRFSKEVKHVLMYATSPVGAVVGYFEIESIEEESPDNLWNIFHRVSGLQKSDYEKYYFGKTRGVAIRIAKSVRLEKPLPLWRLDSFTAPPQSFCYLDDKSMDFVTL